MIISSWKVSVSPKSGSLCVGASSLAPENSKRSDVIERFLCRCSWLKKHKPWSTKMSYVSHCELFWVVHATHTVSNLREAITTAPCYVNREPRQCGGDDSSSLSNRIWSLKFNASRRTLTYGLTLGPPWPASGVRTRPLRCDAWMKLRPSRKWSLLFHVPLPGMGAQCRVDSHSIHRQAQLSTCNAR